MVGLGGEWIRGHRAQPVVGADPRPGVSAAWRVLRADQERWGASTASAQGGDPHRPGSATSCPAPGGLLPTGDRWVDSGVPGRVEAVYMWTTYHLLSLRFSAAGQMSGLFVCILGLFQGKAPSWYFLIFITTEIILAVREVLSHLCRMFHENFPFWKTILSL